MRLLTLGHKRKWAVGCIGGLGILMVMAIAVAILDRALSKGLAPLGATIPFEVVQVKLQASSHRNDDASEALVIPEKGDRFDLTVQHHAQLAKGEPVQSIPALGYVVARRNECLVAFSVPSQAQSQIQGYRTTTVAAYVAALYYDLRGGLLLLGHGPDNRPDNKPGNAPTHELSPERDDLSAVGSDMDSTVTPSQVNKTSQTPQMLTPSLHYLLLDSRWCTWLKVHEGMAIAAVPLE